ncbi:hypothetical protein C8J57DRAFT_1251902 [Mycena rebaudengoi]|nr:hypothetical protein C8J57DRAFT_1251902 [Mycena rebaudengoi]
MSEASDPTQCRARDQHEVFEGVTICVNCRHMESAHPLQKRSAGEYLKDFHDAGKFSSARAATSAPKATKEEGEAETSSSLQHKPTTDTEPGRSNKRTKKKGKVKETEKACHSHFPHHHLISFTLVERDHFTCLTYFEHKLLRQIKLNTRTQKIRQLNVGNG